MKQTMTTYQKWLRKKMKRHGELNATTNDSTFITPNGVVKITRIKYNERTAYDGTVYSSCEVDIEYKGTIKTYGDIMGPRQSVNINGYGGRRSWRSTVQRNSRLRRAVQSSIVDHLKYFGVNLRWNSELTIKKVVWETWENNNI
jgi:hypothetical protein